VVIAPTIMVNPMVPVATTPQFHLSAGSSEREQSGRDGRL